MKYVIIERWLSTDIIVFPETFSHSDFEGMGKIISAGCVGRHSGTKSGFYTYGESKTLGLKSRTEDQIFLDMLLKDKDD
jgi:hypothetical protein